MLLSIRVLSNFLRFSHAGKAGILSSSVSVCVRVCVCGCMLACTYHAMCFACKLDVALVFARHSLSKTVNSR